MINVAGIDWSKVTKAGEIAPPKFAPKGVTTFMQPPKQSVNLKKFMPQVAPKEEYISPYMELNKPITSEQKQVVMALGANIKKGDDLATIRQKFPEIADIGDKSLQALRANIMKGDSPEMIEKKFPELQWIKTKQTDDKYKYNIMNKPTQFLQGLREKAENIDIPVVEPLAKGVLGTAMLGTKGMRDVIQGGAGLLDKGIAGATGTDKVYKSGVAEDVFDVAQGSSNTLASVVAPVSVTALGTVMSALPKPVQQSVGDIFQNIGGFIAKTPGLKQWKESLPPERRAEFDNEVMGGLTALFFGAKNKLNLLKNPKAFVQENILNPQNVFKNIEKNVFNIPGRIKNIPTDITNKSKDLGETVLSSSRKIQPAIKSKFNETFGDKIEGFALKNGLVGSDVSDSAKLANNFKIEKMANKIDEVAKFGWTKNDDIYKLISRETIDMFEKNFSKAIKKNIDDFTSKDWELVKRTDKSGFDMYEQLKKFQNSDDITYLQLEALKEVFDYYNPAKLEYDYKGRPVNVGEKDFWFGARNKLQDDIETAGEKNGVDIKGINKDIQKVHILYRGLTRAEARMDNHNILGLMDTQIATFGTLVGGGAAGIGGLLVRKALQSDSFLSGLSKTLYGSKSRTPYNLSNTSSTSRVGRISNSLRSTYNSALAIPKGQKLNSPIPGPAPIRPDVVTPTGKVIPSKFKKVIEMGEAKQPGTTKIDSGPQVVKLGGQEDMPKMLPNTNLPKKMPKSLKSQDKQAVIEGEKVGEGVTIEKKIKSLQEDIKAKETFIDSLIKGGGNKKGSVLYDEYAKMVGEKGALEEQLKYKQSKILRGTKGMTADDIMKTYPNIKLKKDVVATDMANNKVKIPEGEKLTPYELKGNKILLQDGKTYIVSKNQFENIKGQSVVAEGKPFAPELDGIEESVFENGLYDTDTKYSKYQLPGGGNYREILIKAPVGKIRGDFKSSHRDEPNVIAHLRMNERTYNGKKVLFMEELQSDWAREARKGGTLEAKKINAVNDPRVTAHIKQKFGEKYRETKPKELLDDDRNINQGSIRDYLEKYNPQLWEEVSKDYGKPHPLVKNWQEVSIKRALKEAVDSNAEYFAWINGEQTSARYNLATHVDNVSWGKGDGYAKRIEIKAKQNKTISMAINKDGVIESRAGTYNVPPDWKGKKLDEVLGKGLADKIMEKETGKLEGEGLKFGGEWANNLYDKQVKNIVEDLTYGKVEMIDLGLGKDTEQQAIRLTPEIKARIRGEAPEIKTSGKKFGGLPLKK